MGRGFGRSVSGAHFYRGAANLLEIWIREQTPRDLTAGA
jgi:hypothetical protein